eukprot:299473-Pyramimonas_sp.AAC.1
MPTRMKLETSGSHLDPSWGNVGGLLGSLGALSGIVDGLLWSLWAPSFRQKRLGNCAPPRRPNAGLLGPLGRLLPL